MMTLAVRRCFVAGSSVGTRFSARSRATGMEDANTQNALIVFP
jgi:hypothetical protein